MSETYLRSGALAKLTGVSTDTLRHYERLGLLAKPPRTTAGYRLYPPSTLDRVKLIRRAMSVGFSLDELTRILKNRDRGGAPCQHVRQLAAEKLTSLEQQIEDLQILRDQMRAMLHDWDMRLARTPDGHKALLLESLLEEGTK